MNHYPKMSHLPYSYALVYTISGRSYDIILLILHEIPLRHFWPTITRLPPRGAKRKNFFLPSPHTARIYQTNPLITPIQSGFHFFQSKRFQTSCIYSFQTNALTRAHMYYVLVASNEPLKHENTYVQREKPPTPNPFKFK